MNSITTAIDWIEENPEKGTELLYALAKESDIILEISSKKRIPIEQELELCRAHVKIMSFRKEQGYSIYTKGIESGEFIPPAILHTVIENGITHNTMAKEEIGFDIQFHQNAEFKEYYIFVEGNNNLNTNPIIEGTGIKYIKARLQESYPDQWELHSHPHKEGWETRIRILR